MRMRVISNRRRGDVPHVKPEIQVVLSVIQARAIVYANACVKH